MSYNPNSAIFVNDVLSVVAATGNQNTSLAISSDFERILLNGATDDGVSALQVNGNLAFQGTGLIGTAPSTDNTSISQANLVFYDTYGVGGIVDGTYFAITFHSGVQGGANAGLTYTAIYYLADQVLHLTTPTTYPVAAGDQYSVTGTGYSGSNGKVGRDETNHYYNFFYVASIPAGLVNGESVSYTITSGPNTGDSAIGTFYILPGPVYEIGGPVTTGQFSTLMSNGDTFTITGGVSATSMDIVNRLLYASDGITTALNWSTPGTILINNLQVTGNASLLGRTLLGGATDDGSSVLQLNGNLVFQSGLIVTGGGVANTSINYTGQIVMCQSLTGLGSRTITFTSGANNGFSSTATGYSCSLPTCIVYYLDNQPPFVPAINDTYTRSGDLTTYIVGQDTGGNWYYPYILGAQPPGWTDGTSENATFTNGSEVGISFNINFDVLTSGIYAGMIQVPHGTSPNPAGTSTEFNGGGGTESIDTINRLLIANNGATTNLDWSNPGRVLIAGATDDGSSALQVNGNLSLQGSGFVIDNTNDFNSIDPTNRLLIANDGSTTNLDWANPGRVLINGATDDSVSALQVNGAINVGNGNQFINADGSIGIGAVNSNPASSNNLVIGNGSTLGSTSSNTVIVGPNIILSPGNNNMTVIGSNITTNDDNSVLIGHALTGGYEAVNIGVFNNANSDSVAVGSGLNVGYLGIGIGTANIVSQQSIGIGNEITIGNQYSCVMGIGIYPTILTDVNAPGGWTFGGVNSTLLTGENWLMINPGTAANTPRVIIGSTVTDDNSSALQVYGGIRLADYTTISTPVEGQLAYNYTTHVTTYYNGTAWV